MLNDPDGLLKLWDVFHIIGGKAKTEVAQNHKTHKYVQVCASWKMMFLKVWILLVDINGGV